MDLNEIHEKLGSAETAKDHLKLYCELFKILSKKPREDNGAFLSVTPLVSKALVDLNIQDAELQQRILLSLGLLLCKNNPVELPVSLKQQAIKDVINLLMVSSDKSVTFRSFWCLSQFLDAGLVMEESMVHHVLKSIESVQSSCMRNVTLYGEACGLLQKMIEKNIDGLFKHVTPLAKLVFTPVFHPVSKIREISYKNLQLVTPILQSGHSNDAGSPVGSVILDLVKKMLEDMHHLFRNKNEIYVLEVWNIVVNILGQSLHKNVNAINGLLSVVEKGFKHESQGVKLKSFDAWKTLISNFALSEDVICIPKKLRLLLQPLLRISSTKTEAVIQAKCDTWWHIAWSLGDKIPNHFELVCLPLLEFVCGTSFKDNGEIAVLQQTTVYSSSQQRIMKHKGCEILIRFLEQPLSGTFLHSPKKTPTLSIPPLRKSVSAVIFPKFPREFVKATGVVVKEFGKEQQMLSHTDYLLKLILFAISNIPHDASKDCIDAVASFVQLVVDIVKCQLCPPPLCSKLVDKVSQLPKKMLTAHYYYVGSTGVMHGNLYLTILSLLLHPTFLTMPDFKHRVVPLFQKLAGSSIKSSLSPLSYAHSIILFMKDQTVINNCDAEVLLNLWSAVSSALFAAVQETLEISGGSCFEQDFTCMYDVLTYPFEYVLILNTSQGQFKSILTKSWGDLYKLFYRCSALLPSTDNNSVCDGICSQLLKCLNRDNIENSSICEVLSHILPIIVECVDFEAVGKYGGKGGFNAERWAKSKQNPLGNIAPLIDVIKWFLTHFHETMSLESSSKDKDAQQSTIKFAVMYLEILNTFISKITSSKALYAVLDQLAEPLSKIYELSRKKNISTKKNVHTFLTQLEILWKTITINIQVHYTAQYDSEFLQVLSPLLEVNLRHHKQEIKDRTRQFWFASFAPNQSKLEYPSSLKEILKKLRPPLLPGSDTSPIEEDSPFTDLTEDQAVLMPPPKEIEQPTPLFVKPLSSVLSSPSQYTRKVNESNSPSVKTKTLSKGKPDKVSIDDLPQEEFVEIKLPPSTKKILTRRQKEAMKKKSYVPALYSELSQNSSSMDYSADTQESQDSCSVKSVSQDEHEVSVLGLFHSSVGETMHEGEKESSATVPGVNASKMKEIATLCADNNMEMEKSENTPGEVQIIEPIKPVIDLVEQTTELLDSAESNKDEPPILFPEVQVVEEEIEVIDVESQSDEGSTEISENVEKETSAIRCGGEAANLVSVESFAKEVSESVTSESPDLQCNSVQQEADNAAVMEGSRLCDSNNSNSCDLPENKQGENVEFALSLPEGDESEDMNVVTDSEEIIPSSQSSSEGDHDISKDSGLLCRLKCMQKIPVSVQSSVPHVVFCGKPLSNSNVVSSDNIDNVSTKATRTSVVAKSISGDKLNGLPAVISVEKINSTAVEYTGTSEESNIVSDSKQNENLSDSLSMKEIVIQENLPNGCEKTENALEETKIGGTVAGPGEICDNHNSIVCVLDPLSKENVKKKLCIDLQDVSDAHNDISLSSNEGKSNAVNGHCSDSLAKGKKPIKVDKNTEKSASPKKAANKNCFSENTTRSKSSQNSPIIISVGNESSYIKTRRQVIQHSPLMTRSRLKSSNVTSDLLNISSSGRKKGSKRGGSVKSPKKNVESNVAHNLFSEPQNTSSQSSVSISVESVMHDHEYPSASQEPSECRTKAVQDVESNREPKKLDNYDVKVSGEMQSAPSICIDAENDGTDMETEMIVDDPESVNNIKCSTEDDKDTNNLNVETANVNEVKCSIDDNKGTNNSNVETANVNEVKCSIEDKITNNVNLENGAVCQSDDSPITFIAICDAKENELKETNHLDDHNVACEKSSSRSDKSGASAVSCFDVEKNFVSCNLEGNDDDSVDQTKSSEISLAFPEISKHDSKSLAHDIDGHTVICETEDLVSDKAAPPHSCVKTGEESPVNKQNSENNDEIEVCVLEQGVKLCSDGAKVDENADTTNETLLHVEVSEKAESDCSASKEKNVTSEGSVPLSPNCVTNSENEINPDANKSGHTSENTSDSSASYRTHNEQVRHCDHHTAAIHPSDISHVLSTEQIVRLDTEQSNEILTDHEKGAAESEDSPSDTHPAAHNELNSSSPSHNVTVVKMLTQKSDKPVKEPEIYVGNLPSLVDEEIGATCTEMTEVQKDSCEKTANNRSLQNDLKEKIEDNSMYKDVIVEEPKSDNETIENQQTDIQDVALQSSSKLNAIRGSGSPSKKFTGLYVSPVSSAENSVKFDAFSVSPFVSIHGCDNEPSLSPCSGAKKRKQKTPSNSCVAIDIKRKKLEMRGKKDTCEKLSSPKQTCRENVVLECTVSPAKHPKTEDTSVPAKVGTYIESNECTRTVPEKFMQLWHSSIVMNSDASMTVQEKKQRLLPEKLKNGSPNSKGNQPGFEPDKAVVEDIRMEETSGSSVLRDVRNSPLQWRSTSSSVISVPVSPLSRSQRMVRAARKHMSSPDNAKQTGYSRPVRTTSLESPSTSKTSPSTSENSKVSSPAYSSILKKRTPDSSSTPSPPLKKRKVSFADPLVQGEMIIESCDNENSCRARRSAKRCLQMNRDSSQRSRRKFFWYNQDQEKLPSLKKTQQFLNNDGTKIPVENSGTASENEYNQEKLEGTAIKKSEEKMDEIIAEEKIDETRSEQNSVILEKVNESTCPPSVAFSTSHLLPTLSPTSSDIPSTDTYENSEDFNYNSQAIVFEELVGCNAPVDCVIPLLTSPMWVRGLSQLLLSRKINTIGDLSGLTVENLKALPIKSPKLETVQSILKLYALQRIKSSSCKLNTASSSSPKKCDSSNGKTDVMQTSVDYHEDIPVVEELPAIPVQHSGSLEEVHDTDFSVMQVEPSRISESPCKTDSQSQLDEEHDREKCRELIEKLCSSQVIQEMPLVLLCDLISKISNGIKAKSCQMPQEEEK